MKFVVTSDNHGLKDKLEMVRKMHRDYDAYIHCGDSEMTLRELSGWASVAGNNDYYADLPNSRIINLNGFKIYVTHSHLVSYFKRTERLIEAAKANGCQMVCFGHTHIYTHEIIDGIHLLNPGSLRYNRDASQPCYAVVEVNDNDYSKVRVRRIDY
jgi:putative phosphoesterase